MLVVEEVDDAGGDDGLEGGDGEDDAGGGGGAFEGDFQFVVVAVAVGVGAAAEDLPIFPFGKGGAVEAVGGGEFKALRELDHGRLLVGNGEGQIGAEGEGKKIEVGGGEAEGEVGEEGDEEGGGGEVFQDVRIFLRLG